MKNTRHVAYTVCDLERFRGLGLWQAPLLKRPWGQKRGLGLARPQRCHDLGLAQFGLESSFLCYVNFCWSVFCACWQVLHRSRESFQSKWTYNATELSKDEWQNTGRTIYFLNAMMMFELSWCRVKRGADVEIRALACVLVTRLVWASMQLPFFHNTPSGQTDRPTDRQTG